MRAFPVDGELPRKEAGDGGLFTDDGQIHVHFHSGLVVMGFYLTRGVAGDELELFLLPQKESEIVCR